MTSSDAADRRRKTYSQAQRLLRIYLALANARMGLTVHQLIERTKVTRRTINRDLSILCEDHLIRCIDVDADGRKRWALLPTGPAGGVSFTQGELLSLCLGRSMLSFAQGSELYASMNNAFIKVADRLGGQEVAGLALDRKLYAVPDAPPVNINSESFDDCLNELLTAVLRENQVEVDYPQSRREGFRTWRVDPLTIAYYRGRLYLVACEHQRDQVRLFAIHRVVAARWLRNTDIVIPPGYRPDMLFSNRFGIFQGEQPKIVTARFRPAAARYARERLWHHSQRCQTLEDGRTEMSWTIPCTPELFSWLLSFGAAVEVVSPERLRAEIIESLEEATAQYASK